MVIRRISGKNINEGSLTNEKETRHKNRILIWKITVTADAASYEKQHWAA
jgi:hypothetical protein